MIAVIRFSQRVIVSYNDGSQLLICKVPIRFGDTYAALTLATGWILNRIENGQKSIEA